MRITVTSGFYNPIHRGHIEYLSMAKEQGDYHIAIVNSDYQAGLKGSMYVPQGDRLSVVKALKSVDDALLAIDSDITVKETLFLIKKSYPGDEIVFCKGGDRTSKNIPESQICEELGITIIDGLGQKVQSSSNIRRALCG